MPNTKSKTTISKALRADIKGIAEDKVKALVKGKMTSLVLEYISETAGYLVGKLSTLDAENKNERDYAHNKFYGYLLKETLLQLREELKKERAR